MRHELLLTWASEVGAGSWDDLRAAHEWVAGEGDGAEGSRASTTARTLATLGHLEVDWNDRRWAVTPSVLTMLPEAGGYALLIGSRTRALIAALGEQVESSQTLILERRPQRDAPDAIFIGCEDESEVERLAEELEILFVSSVSDELSRVLPPLACYLRTSPISPPPRGIEAQAFQSSGTGKWWADTAAYDEPGLYRFNVYGRPAYRWVTSDGTPREVEMEVGIFLELSRRDVHILEYVPDTRNGTLRCHARAQLPPLHARAAALCSGLAPARENWVDSYVNVPRELAERLAASLNQRLRVLAPIAEPAHASQKRLRPPIRTPAGARQMEQWRGGPRKGSYR